MNNNEIAGKTYRLNKTGAMRYLYSSAGLDILQSSYSAGRLAPSKESMCPELLKTGDVISIVAVNTLQLGLRLMMCAEVKNNTGANLFLVDSFEYFLEFWQEVV